MQPKEISDRIDHIAAALVHNDDEKAHSLEDKLRLDFIKYIESSEKLPISLRRKAEQIIELSTWDFRRWCA